MIRLLNVTKTFGAVRAIREFTMNVKDDSVYALVGPKNSGKTTVLSLIAGITRPDEGEVIIDGMEAGTPIRRLKRRIGYVPASSGSYRHLSVREFMYFFAECYDLYDAKLSRRIDELLESVELSSHADEKMENLTPGMKKRLSIARALLPDPRYLLIDEPFIGLDVQSRQQVRSMLLALSGEGRTMILASENLKEVEDFCTDLGIIHQKMLMEGEISSVLEQLNAANPILIRVNGSISGALRVLKKDRRVHSISIRGQELAVSFSGSPDNEAKLLAALLRESVPVAAFRREQGDLESLIQDQSVREEERSVTWYEAESDLS